MHRCALLLLSLCVLERPDGRDPPSRAPTRTSSLFELRADLGAPRPETRRAAVRSLAALGTREAYAALLAALADRDGSVASEAQVRAAAPPEPRALVELFGPLGLRSREPGAAERAAEALGRSHLPVPCELLERALRSADPPVARLLCWSVERLAPAQRLAGERAPLAERLMQLCDAREPPEVRGAALLALRYLDTRAADERTEAAASAREPALRCAAALAARAWSEIPATRLGARLAADPDAGVRAGAIELLARTTGRDAALALVERLEREERARLRWRILSHLRALSGEDHAFDAARWREWARTRAGAVATGDARGGPVGDTRVALAGLPLTSDRVAFLIDLSGSMWGTRVAGRTRKEIVDAELARALATLPRSARFNVIPYATEAFPWERALQAADPGTLRRAAADFARCQQSGRGNLWAAVEAACSDPDLDAVVVLTDGVPTGGPHGDFDLLQALLLERNRFRNVAFDLILVDAPRTKVLAWTAFAAATGGRTTSVALATLAEKGAREPRRGG
ncbi:MAG: hypothetical protein JNK02_05385 [Planctomycetes bacterium]|nr:hypothetical protein [Planctomycetota bacterium]